MYYVTRWVGGLPLFYIPHSVTHSREKIGVAVSVAARATPTRTLRPRSPSRRISMHDAVLCDLCAIVVRLIGDCVISSGAIGPAGLAKAEAVGPARCARLPDIVDLVTGKPGVMGERVRERGRSDTRSDRER